jgi:hypothetical protein
MDYEKQSFERMQPVARAESALPAATYNLTRILLAASASGSVFVPIRSMQYLAVIDAEEIIFVDGQYRRWVEVAWRRFHPGGRQSLTDAVPYEALFYTAGADATQRRLLSDFHVALNQLDTRRRPTGSGVVLPLRGLAL